MLNGAPALLRLRSLMPGTGASPERAEKTVHLRIDPNDETTTLEDVLSRISELQRKHPDREVFFDGDEYAICSRPKRPRAAPAR
jgi:hypothetical protein